MEGRVRSGAGILALAAAVAAIAAPAQASTDPSRSEAKAIEKAFLAKAEDDPRILRIRVSTEDPDFAAVFYEVAVEPPPTSRGLVAAPTVYKPPPAILKAAKGGKWKTVAKAPAKVLKDLKVKPRKSLVEISGDFTATLTQPATCTDSGDFYSAAIYDKDIDLYLSIQIFQYAGHGWYPARSVGSVAGLYSDAGTVLRYETGLAHDAFTSTGDILAKGGWAYIGAGMARTPPEEGTESNTVIVRGVLECR